MKDLIQPKGTSEGTYFTSTHLYHKDEITSVPNNGFEIPLGIIYTMFDWVKSEGILDDSGVQAYRTVSLIEWCQTVRRNEESSLSRVKHRKSLTHRLSITPQETRILNYTTVRTSNLKILA